MQIYNYTTLIISVPLKLGQVNLKMVSFKK